MRSATVERGHLAGRVAVVTGGGGGLGSSICRRLATDGASVVVADVAGSGHQTVARSVVDSGCSAWAMDVDVADDRRVAAFCEAVESRHGATSILVNCAALYAGLPRQPFWEIDDDLFIRVMDVNVIGTFRVTKHFVEQLAASGSGRVVTVSSVVAYRGTPQLLHYVASKAALLGMTRAMARELGHRGVTVNAVAPGLLDTPSSRRSASPEYMRQLAQERALPRVETAEDVVGAVSWLCSNDAAFVTGQTIVVDGGVVFT